MEIKPVADKTSSMRQMLTICIVIFSIAGIILLGCIAIYNDTSTKGETTKYILGVLLPLIGTWMGSVIAFYFGKENFDAASKSMQQVIKQLTPDDKLKSIIANDKMIKVEKIMKYEALTKDSFIKDIINFMNTPKAEVNRLPVLKADGTIQYCIHLSTFEKYITINSLHDTPLKPVTQLTFGDLTANTAFVQNNLDGSIQTIKSDATFLDAKTAMDKSKNCEDVFVTEDGTINSKVLGWITDGIILENSKV